MTSLISRIFGSNDNPVETRDQKDGKGVMDAHATYILHQCEADMQSLMTASETIKHTTDGQYELIQSILDRQMEGGREGGHVGDRRDTSKADKGSSGDKCKGHGAEEVLKEANKYEQRQLASMQDNFCLQATVIQNTVHRFNSLFQQLRRCLNLDSNLDLLSSHSTPKKVRTDELTRSEKIDSEFYRKQISEKEDEIRKLKQEWQGQHDEIEKLKSQLKMKAMDSRTKDTRTSKQGNGNELSGRSQAGSSSSYKRSRIKRKTVSAILYTPRKADMMTMVLDEIRKMLGNQFSMTQTDIHLTDCDVPANISPNVPVIVVCINASRLGTDVSSALHGLRPNPQIAVVILHHKEIHALPNQASDRVLTSSEYKELGGMFDMAFLANRGIYPCDMNNNAISALVEFIQRRNDALGCDA